MIMEPALIPHEMVQNNQFVLQYEERHSAF